MASTYRVPRNFKLLAELEKAQKGEYEKEQKYSQSAPFISLGLNRPDDIMLTTWNASIIPVQGSQVGERFYSMSVTCGPKYPDEPPSVRLSEKVKLGCVDSVGNLNVRRLLTWRREMCIMDILVALRSSISKAAKECAKVTGVY